MEFQQHLQTCRNQFVLEPKNEHYSFYCQYEFLEKVACTSFGGNFFAKVCATIAQEQASVTPIVFVYNDNIHMIYCIRFYFTEVWLILTESEYLSFLNELFIINR